MTTLSQKPWYENWFNTHYIELYANRDTEDAKKQIDLITQTLPLECRTEESSGSIILDIGCGYGRHVSLLLERGYTATGIDLSQALIEHGRKNNPKLPIVVGDMRELDKAFSPGSHSLLLLLFTSFGYFETKAEHIQALKNMATILDLGGWIWLDFLNATQVERFLKSETKRTLPSGKQFYEKRKIEQGRIIKDIYVTLPREASHSSSIKKTSPLHYQESVALYTLDELLKMGEAAGLTAIHTFGDYNGSNFTPEAPRTIIVFQKN